MHGGIQFLHYTCTRVAIVPSSHNIIVSSLAYYSPAFLHVLLYRNRTVCIQTEESGKLAETSTHYAANLPLHCPGTSVKGEEHAYIYIKGILHYHNATTCQEEFGHSYLPLSIFQTIVSTQIIVNLEWKRTAHTIVCVL